MVVTEFVDRTEAVKIEIQSYNLCLLLLNDGDSIEHGAATSPLSFEGLPLRHGCIGVKCWLQIFLAKYVYSTQHSSGL